MPTIYDLKSSFQNVLRPITRFLAKCGISANQVTISALALSFFTGLLVAIWPQSSWVLLFIPIVLILRMGLNAIDGMLAREHNMSSAFGAILNELGDVISDTALYLPFARIYPDYSFLVVLIVIVSIISEMTGVVGVQIGADRRYEGPMGKSDRAFVFGAIALLLGLGLNPGWWYLLVLIAVLILLILTIRNRINGALSHV